MRSGMRYTKQVAKPPRSHGARKLAVVADYGEQLVIRLHAVQRLKLGGKPKDVAL